MKRQMQITKCIAAFTLGVMLTLGTAAQAADNIGLGDIAGDPLALADSNIFTLNSSTPTLFKSAFLTVGNTALTSGDSLPAGTSVDFLIYLSNEADLTILDAGIQDTLVGFTYVPNSIRVNNATAECAIALACTPAEELAIYNAARVVAISTDAPDDDNASFGGTTVEVGNSVTAGNTQQDAAANAVLALVFTATLD